MTTATIYVIQCLDEGSEHYGAFYIGSGVVTVLSHAQTYSWLRGAQKAAKRLNADYNGAGHFHTQGWTPVSCQITLGIPE